MKAVPARVPSTAERLAFADAALRVPPAREWIDRPPARGELVARFVLPLEMCVPPNRIDPDRPHQTRLIAKWKRECFVMMLAQQRGPREPLPGRPQIRIVRFSSVEPDPGSNWDKFPIDCLCVPRRPKKPGGRGKQGLGFIRDDSNKLTRTDKWWEPAPRKQGFVYLEVRTG